MVYLTINPNKSYISRVSLGHFEPRAVGRKDMEIARIGLVTLETETEGGTEGVRVGGDWTAKFHFGIAPKTIAYASTKINLKFNLESG